MDLLIQIIKFPFKMYTMLAQQASPTTHLPSPKRTKGRTARESERPVPNWTWSVTDVPTMNWQTDSRCYLISYISKCFQAAPFDPLMFWCEIVIFIQWARIRSTMEYVLMSVGRIPLCITMESIFTPLESTFYCQSQCTVRRVLELNKFPRIY